MGRARRKSACARFAVADALTGRGLALGHDSGNSSRGSIYPSLALTSAS